MTPVLESPRAVSFTPAQAALLELLSGINEVASVQKLRYSIDGGKMDLWVLFQNENLADARRIYELEDAYAQLSDALPIDVHVIPTDVVDEENLPPARTLFVQR